ncbi:MAG TPA: hypothetical protein PKW63_11985 [Vicinamibacterales bacterium]|jgi:hypothetical protein|nr:hypothetical protein [Vicinamibacterales bacterium]
MKNMKIHEGAALGARLRRGRTIEGTSRTNTALEKRRRVSFCSPPPKRHPTSFFRLAAFVRDVPSIARAAEGGTQRRASDCVTNPSWTFMDLHGEEIREAACVIPS